MPKRVPNFSVQVVREGKLIRPALGVPFEFSADELADIKRMQPDAVRMINDESALITSEESQAGTLTLDLTPDSEAAKLAGKSSKSKADKDQGL